ncbi:MAG: Eco47II family restriction endonuclease [Alphaproteobacteria bacterium]
MTYNLTFISKNDLQRECLALFQKVIEAVRTVDKNFNKNRIDAFSALFESGLRQISLEEWVRSEKQRQFQKTLQNEIGYFHQRVAGHIQNCQDLGVGKLIDFACPSKRIIAEIKNKHNTVKGSDQIVIYDALEKCLQKQGYQGFTGYYVTMIPKKRGIFSFTPSDNKTHTRRPDNPQIKMIDGISFYQLLTDDEDALFKLYYEIPKIMRSICPSYFSNIENEDLFLKNFEASFK